MTKCLIVDDSRVIRKLASRMMAALDIETSEDQQDPFAMDVVLDVVEIEVG